MSEELLNELAGLASATRSRVYVVGGYLRDRLLGREPVDIDLLVEGNPAPFLEALARRADCRPVVFDRKEPATWRVPLGEWLVDVSSCPAGGLNASMQRRDFTINALAAPLRGAQASGTQSPESPLGPPVDLAGGLQDLHDRRIRCIAPERFDEDPVRLLRAVRLAVLLEGYRLGDGMLEAIRLRAGSIAQCPAERIRPELELILASERAGKGLRLLKASGLLFPILPGLVPLDGLVQNAWHQHDVLEHTLIAVEELDSLAGGNEAAGLMAPLSLEEAEAVKWAALLHDTGKAETSTTDARGQIHFYGHEVASARIARSSLTALRMSTRRIDRIAHLVLHHLRLPLLSASPNVSERALRRFVHQAKHDTPLLCMLALADRRAGGGPDHEMQMARLTRLSAQVMEIFSAEGEQIISPPPLLTGNEVMEALDLPPGPGVGAILRWLTRLQVEGRVATRDQAIEMVKSLPAARLMTLDRDD